MTTCKVSLIDIEWDEEDEDRCLPETMEVDVPSEGLSESEILNTAIDVAADTHGICISGAFAKIIH